MTSETNPEAGLRRQLDDLADLMPTEPSRLRSVQRRVRRRRQRRAAGLLTVVAGATVATGALSSRARSATVASLAPASKTADTSAGATPTGTDGAWCPAIGKPAPAAGAAPVETAERVVKGMGTVTAVDGDRLTIDVSTPPGTVAGAATSSSGVVTQAKGAVPASSGESPLPATVEAVRTASTLLLDHGSAVTTLDTPVGTVVAFAGSVGDDGTVTLVQLEAPVEKPVKPAGPAAEGTDRLAKGRGTIVAIDGDSVVVKVTDGALAGQTVTMQGPPVDPACGPATVGATVGFEAASSDGGTTYRVLLVSS